MTFRNWEKFKVAELELWDIFDFTDQESLILE